MQALEAKLQSTLKQDSPFLFSLDSDMQREDGRDSGGRGRGGEGSERLRQSAGSFNLRFIVNNEQKLAVPWHNLENERQTLFH